MAGLKTREWNGWEGRLGEKGGKNEKKETTVPSPREKNDLVEPGDVLVQGHKVASSHSQDTEFKLGRGFVLVLAVFSGNRIILGARWKPNYSDLALGY